MYIDMSKLLISLAYGLHTVQRRKPCKIQPRKNKVCRI